MNAETKTARARKMHDKLIALRAKAYEARQDLKAVREEIERGFENEAERNEYETSEDFLSSEVNRLSDEISDLRASARKAGLGELIEAMDRAHILGRDAA